MLPIEKLAAIVIFAIVLVVLIIFTQIPQMILGQINQQQELNNCCKAYLLSNCPDSLASIRCDDKTLDTLAKDNNIIDSSGNADVDRIKIFCSCPKK